MLSQDSLWKCSRRGIRQPRQHKHLERGGAKHPHHFCRLSTHTRSLSTQKIAAPECLPLGLEHTVVRARWQSTLLQWSGSRRSIFDNCDNGKYVVYIHTSGRYTSLHLLLKRDQNSTQNMYPQTMEGRQGNKLN